MKQANLIRIASEKTDFAIWEYRIVLDAFVETATAVLKSGETVKLAGFGKLKVKTLHTRYDRNKKKGAPKCVVPQRKIDFIRAKSFELDLTPCCK